MERGNAPVTQTNAKDSGRHRISADTNLIVRLLVGDDPRQTPIAEQAFLKAIATGGMYLLDVVLAEVACAQPRGGPSSARGIGWACPLGPFRLAPVRNWSGCWSQRNPGGGQDQSNGSQVQHTRVGNLAG